MYAEPKSFSEMAKENVLQMIEEQAMQVGEQLWLAQVKGIQKIVDVKEEEFRLLNALALIVAPPRYEFTAFNRYENCTSPQRQIQVLQRELSTTSPNTYFADLIIEHINQLHMKISQ